MFAKAPLAQNLSSRAGACGPQASADRRPRTATPRWDRTARPAASSGPPPAPTTGSRRIRWPALRWPAAAPISSVANGGSGRSDLFQAGAFVRHNIGAAYISAALAYGWQDVTTDRTVTIAGVDRLRAEFNANAWSGRVEGGYRFVTPWTGGIGITPYAAGTVHHLRPAGLCREAWSPAPTPLRWPMAPRASPTPAANSACAPTNPLRCRDAILTLRGRAAWAHDFNTGPRRRRDLPGAAGRELRRQRCRDRPATPRSPPPRPK